MLSCFGSARQLRQLSRPPPRETAKLEADAESPMTMGAESSQTGSAMMKPMPVSVWVPDIRFTLCDLLVLMDQPTKAILSHDPCRRRHDN
jgi:hypothetical protein